MPADFNKKIVGDNFSRAAKNYENSAPVQMLAAETLCKLASHFIKDDSQILDLGSGTGFVAKQLHNLKIFESDLAFGMLEQSGSRSFKIQSDFENLPFKNHSFDILISSFSLQWMTNFEENFSHFFSLLKPDGIFAFCIPTDGSLAELKAANIFVINQFPKIDELKSALNNCGFEEVFCETEIVKQRFENGVAAIKSLKKIGANNSSSGAKTITKTALEQFNNFCLKNSSSSLKNPLVKNPVVKKIETSWHISYFILSKR